MSKNKLNITQLDFDSIKNNLKSFLKKQTEFQDYDFDGAGLNVLIELLAYNTHYNSYYLNMVANEAFLATAILRDSVVSHSKTLGYTPYSKTASSAIVNITIPEDANQYPSITIPRGFSFKSEVIDNTTYNFCTLDEYTASRVNGNYYFEDIPIYEGSYTTFNFFYDQDSNPKAMFTIPDINIDTKTIKVTVKESTSNTEVETYSLASDILEVDGDSPVFFIQEISGKQYQIYFGNGSVGKSLPPDSTVTVTFLSTSGEDANKLKVFTAVSKINSFTTYIVETVQESFGGADRQTVDDIKFNAISQYSTQNRLVTLSDYGTYIKSRYPSIDSLSVWGGEDMTPKVYGKVFVSIKPKDGYFLSEDEKQRVIDDIIAPKSIISITHEIIDPDYLFIILNIKVRYDQNKTTSSPSQLVNSIKETVLTYNRETLNKFNASLISSRLQDNIDSTDGAIIGNDIDVKVQKRFTPVFGRNYNYNLQYNLPLKKGTSSDRLMSSEFIVIDSNGVKRQVIIEEVPNSDTGISSIFLINPGTGFTSQPTVTITGDGYGATAEAKIVNGRIEVINVTNRGIDYSRAVVNITGGGGIGASAVAIIDTRIGDLRLVYFNANAERVVINNKIGSINYEIGSISITDLNIQSVSDGSDTVRITIQSDSNMVQSVMNTLLHIDENDPSSIQITTHNV